MNILDKIIDRLNERIERADFGIKLSKEEKSEKNLKWWTSRKEKIIFMRDELLDVKKIGEKNFCSHLYGKQEGNNG